MTEADWLTARHSDDLLRFIEPRASDRKLHYFAIACARRIAPLLPFPESLHGVDVLERFVEGQCGADAIEEVSWNVEGAAFAAEAGQVPWRDAVEELPLPLLTELAANPEYAFESVRRLLTSAAYFVDAVVSPVPWQRRARDWPRNPSGSLFQPVSLVHDVFGNPFRTVRFRGAWRSEAVAGLARGMYESGDFAPMPVLADALEDAGCDCPDILAHCRGPGPHVRGCWVVDRVLCKK
jgi:hypothetical protein